MPKRIQRKRARGWKMQDQSNREVVYVGRPTKWGNPFRIREYSGRYAISYGRTGLIETKAEAVRLAVYFFKEWATAKAKLMPEWLDPLRGKDLACWCPLDQPCHADVLLELANEKEV